MSGMMEMLGDPNARHAMIVHTPVVLGSLGVVVVLGLAATGFKNAAMRWVCIAWFAVASAGCAMAALSGEDAEEAVEHSAAMTADAKATLEHHEELGEGGWIWPLIPLAFVMMTFVPRRPVRVGAGVLAIVAAGGVGVWVAATAHEGGRLVYEHGVGAPSPGLSVDASVSGRGPGVEVERD